MSKKKAKKYIKPCKCAAYSFPHRLYGGKCQGNDDVDYKVTEYDLLGLSFRAFTNPTLR